MSAAASSEPPFRAPTQDEIGRLAGDYLCAEHGSTWTLRAEKDKLVLLIGPGLEMETNGRWIRAVGHEHIRMELLEREGGGCPALSMPEDGRPWIYEPVPAFAPARDEALGYAGTYLCDELGAVNQVAVAEEGGLEIWQPKWGRSPLLAVTRDVFTADLSARAGYLFTENLFFDRDQDGRVTGLRIYTSGMHGMPFARVG